MPVIDARARQARQECVILHESAGGWSAATDGRELEAPVARHGRAPQTGTMYPRQACPLPHRSVPREGSKSWTCLR